MTPDFILLECLDCDFTAQGFCPQALGRKHQDDNPEHTIKEDE